VVTLGLQKAQNFDLVVRTPQKIIIIKNHTECLEKKGL